MTDAGRWELLRALGAVADSPAAARAAAPALGLGPVPGTEHTDVFVLNLPPYAAVYLSRDGALGGEAAMRIAGFWRVMGLDAPPEPDHLSALLGLYASLGEAAAEARRPATADALSRAQATLLWEHLRSWLPAYLDAAGTLPGAALRGWSGLLRRALDAEAGRHPALPALPIALREAPPPGFSRAGPRDIADAVTVPARSGMVLTRYRLAEGAERAGVGFRIGERRFALRSMLEQDPAATADWLRSEAARWADLHRTRQPADAAAGRPADPPARWWAGRARHTARALRAFTGDLASAGR